MTDARVQAAIVTRRMADGRDDIEPASATDSKGFFQLAVPAGCDYELSLAKNGFYETDLKSFSVKAGAVRDLGNVHVTQYWKR